MGGLLHAPAALPSGWIIGWASPRTSVDTMVKRTISCLCQESNSGYSVCSLSVNWPSYPGFSYHKYGSLTIPEYIILFLQLEHSSWILFVTYWTHDALLCGNSATCTNTCRSSSKAIINTVQSTLKLNHLDTSLYNSQNSDLTRICPVVLKLFICRRINWANLIGNMHSAKCDLIWCMDKPQTT